MNKRGHVLNGVLLGIGVGVLLEPTGDETTLLSIIEVTVPVTLGALFPDVDTAFGRHRKTLHNIPVLVGFVLFPIGFGNLQWVWLGILTHYVLDMAGSKRGIALFYPFDREYALPTGVATSSEYAGIVTLVITGAELLIAGGVVFGQSQGWLEAARAAVGL